MKTNMTDDNKKENLQNTLQALRQTSLGQLNYDRNWETEGRCQEIIDNVRTRLSALTVSPSNDRTSDDFDYHQAENNVDDGEEEIEDEIFRINSNVVKNGVLISSHSSPHRVEQSPTNGRRSIPIPKYVLEEEEKINAELDQLEQLENEIRQKIEATERNRRLRLLKQMQTKHSDEVERPSPRLSSPNRSQSSYDPDERVFNELIEKESITQDANTVILSKLNEFKHRQTVHSKVQPKLKDVFVNVNKIYNELVSNSSKLKSGSMTDNIQQCEKLKQSFDVMIHKDLVDENDLAQAENVRKTFESTLALIKNELERQQQEEQALKERQAKEQAQLKQQEAKSITETNKTSSTTNDTQQATTTPTKKPTESVTSHNPLRDYIKHQTFLVEYEKNIESFVNGTECKAYRLSLQGFIRTTINTISGEIPEQLRTKFQRLRDLLSGKSLEFQGRQIQATQHEKSLDFCHSYAAKTFISVGIKQVVSLPKAAFPIGSIIAVLWQHFPQFGAIFQAHLVEKCPYLIGYYPEKQEGDSDATYLIACGYVYGSDNETLETEEQFLNRMKALARLYAAIVSANLAEHPRGLSYGWQLMAKLLNTEPRPAITPSILHGFLTMAIYRMLTVYKNQLIKLVNFIQNDYIPRIEAASAKEVKKQAIVTLKNFIEDTQKKIKRNPGQLKRHLLRRACFSYVNKYRHNYSKTLQFNSVLISTVKLRSN